MSHPRSDAVFLADLRRSYQAVAWVAAQLVTHGIAVYVPQARVRPTFEQRAHYNDGGTDLWIGLPDDGGFPVQVKRRNVEFTDLNSFPYPDIFVDTESTLNKMTIPPCWYVMVNRSCTNALVVSTRTHPHWQWDERYDPTRGHVRRFASCPISQAMTFDVFIDRLVQHCEQNV